MIASMAGRILCRQSRGRTAVAFSFAICPPKVWNVLRSRARFLQFSAHQPEHRSPLQAVEKGIDLRLHSGTDLRMAMSDITLINWLLKSMIFSPSTPQMIPSAPVMGHGLTSLPRVQLNIECWVHSWMISSVERGVSVISIQPIHHKLRVVGPDRTAKSCELRRSSTDRGRRR